MTDGAALRRRIWGLFTSPACTNNVGGTMGRKRGRFTVAAKCYNSGWLGRSGRQSEQAGSGIVRRRLRGILPPGACVEVTLASVCVHKRFWLFHSLPFVLLALLVDPVFNLIAHFISFIGDSGTNQRGASGLTACCEPPIQSSQFLP